VNDVFHVGVCAACHDDVFCDESVLNEKKLHYCVNDVFHVCGVYVVFRDDNFYGGYDVFDDDFCDFLYGLYGTCGGS